MDALIAEFVRDIGLSPLNVVLAACVVYIVRERYHAIQADLVIVMQRNERLEKSLLAAGIPLLELEN